MSRKYAISFLVLITSLILLGINKCDRLRHEVQPLFSGERLKAIIDLGAYADTSRELLTGYNYFLLQKYARSHNLNIDISLAKTDGAGPDSLLRGLVDIVVVPLQDSICRDSIIVSSPVDSMSRWVMSSHREDRMKDFNNWMEEYYKSEGYTSIRESFMHVYSPFRSGRRANLSPYDSLIRVHADSLAWDWRMLAAVVWQESAFHIEAHSRKGAAGLMQMMPQTAARFNMKDPLNPEQSIMAGANYLGFLQKKFKHYGNSPEEKYKFVLAAYNAGEGRLQDCIRYALYHNIDISSWQNIADIIPKMNTPQENELELLRFGAFKGRETVHYVDNVFAVYENFCRICPK